LLTPLAVQDHEDESCVADFEVRAHGHSLPMANDQGVRPPYTLIMRSINL
jgi:hypothetical protein